jgi:serine/threonine protein kinase/tetratricopeptide (TPR) repeat protein
MPLEPGDQLGPYKIQALLGAGGMGEVYRGRDTRLGRDVALKVISQRLVGDPSSRRRFEQEARAASALNHPAIVTIYDVGETDDVSWIAMEWVEGRTLRHVLADGPLPIRDAWSIARQVADGLAAAHVKGIIHRDLKPENVMITTEGRAKILDFGLARQNAVEALEAKAEAETVSTPLAGTFAGTILGTVGYMSPEQASGRTADFRSDQFSFGVLLYELLARRRAFDRSSAVETLAAVIREDPVPLGSIRTGISPAFHTVIGRCLAKLPEDRFGSTRELATALESLTPESLETAVATGSSAAEVSQSPVASAPARFRRSLPFILVAASLSLTFAIVSWNRSRVSQPAITSLAVLPFEDTSKNPETEYLGDGLTESLIGNLARVPSLKVMARGTVIRFKGLGDPQQAGRKLGVGAVVTGTVSRRNDRVVISAELIDSSTGERLWGQTYDRPFTDLLRVQDSIVSEISDGLRLHLTGQEKQRLGGFGTQNVAAYELFLKARFLMANDTEEDDLEARKLFTQAVALDPNFLEAHVDIAATYARENGNGYGPPREALAKALEHIRKALAIDPNNVIVRAAEANNRFQTSWDWSTAERDYRALSQETAVMASVQYHPIALFYVAAGRPDEAVALMERALVLDPGNVESRVMLGNFLVQAGRLDDALKVYNTIASEEPKDPRPFLGAADVYKRRGDITRAIESRRKAYELAGDDDAARALAAATTEKDYQKADVAVARLRLQELTELAKERYVSPLDLARLHAMVGEREQALALLEKSMTGKEISLMLLKADQAWDPIRSDPRFAAIVRRVGIP